MTEIAEAQELANQEERLSLYDGQDKVISASEMRQELKDRPKNRVHFYARMPGLDRLLDGFQGGELIALSGPTKNGKTLLAQTLTVRFAEQGISSLWVSFEVPWSQFIEQMPQTCEFYLPKVLTPHNPGWLDERIQEAKLKYNTRAVFIDHLHFLIDLAKGSRNLSVDIGAIVRQLKRCAVRHNIVIFLLCHATKALSPTGEMRELQAFDIRDSSFVPQESDSTWIIQRKMDKETNEFNNKAMLKVCNHRRTGVMEKRITLVKVGLLFEEFHDRQDSKEISEDAPPVENGGSGDDTLPF